jgi:hypothetical protein
MISYICPFHKSPGVSLYSCAEAAYRAVGIFWACREVKNARGEIGTPAHLEARSRADGIEHQSLYCALKCKFSLHRRYRLPRTALIHSLCIIITCIICERTPHRCPFDWSQRLIFWRVISSNCKTWFGTSKNTALCRFYYFIAQTKRSST